MSKRNPGRQTFETENENNSNDERERIENNHDRNPNLNFANFIQSFLRRFEPSLREAEMPTNIESTTNEELPAELETDLENELVEINSASSILHDSIPAALNEPAAVSNYSNPWTPRFNSWVSGTVSGLYSRLFQAIGGIGNSISNLPSTFLSEHNYVVSRMAIRRHLPNRNRRRRNRHYRYLSRQRTRMSDVKRRARSFKYGSIN